MKDVIEVVDRGYVREKMSFYMITMRENRVCGPHVNGIWAWKTKLLD
jgi:hypothetical protein